MVIPSFAKAAMSWLKSRLEVRLTVPCGSLVLQREALFRVDAKAERNSVAIDGWLPFRDSQNKIVKEKSPWFAARITLVNAPWAYDRGKPFKAISSLELLATVVAIILFSPQADPGTRLQSLVSVLAHTDSKVASSVTGRSLTTSCPLCLVAMVATIQMESCGIELSLGLDSKEHES